MDLSDRPSQKLRQGLTGHGGSPFTRTTLGGNAGLGDTQNKGAVGKFVPFNVENELLYAPAKESASDTTTMVRLKTEESFDSLDFREGKGDIDLYTCK